MQITLLKAGMLSTIQDLGRIDYLAQAVPLSGVMDTLSARLANIAIGNSPTDALIEFSYGNASFICNTPVLMAYGGNGAKWFINNEKLPSLRPIFLPKGTEVTLKNSENGARSYLAIAGGWDLPLILNSRSTYLPANLGGYQGRSLKKDDIVSSCNKLTDTTEQMLKSLEGNEVKFQRWAIHEASFKDLNKTIVRIIRGRESAWFSNNSMVNFLNEAFTINLKSNRMGIHLTGPVIERLHSTELLSTAVCAGTIQVTGDGNMILLMADCQTTGGYPRIAQVAMVDLPTCAQLKPGDEIRFTEISQSDAECLYFEREKDLAKLALAIQTIDFTK